MSESLLDERAPLLEEDRTESQARPDTDRVTPLPLQFIVLAFLNAIPPLVFELIFPFVNQMVLETGVTNDPEKVGYYSGILESAFSVTALLTVAPWSRISDLIGRKPVMLISIFGLSTSTCFFGVSQTFPAMLISRALGGLAGNIWGTSRTMAGEMTDETNQAAAFSWMNITYRAGKVLGLPLGGYLSHPGRRFPIFHTEFWLKYPFALPCFAAASIAFVSLVVGQLTLKETLRERKQQADSAGEPVVKKKLKLKDVITPNVQSVLISNLILFFIAESLSTLYPIFAFTPVRSGGLGLDEATIGIHLAIRAFLCIPAMALYPQIDRRVGTLRFYQICMVAFPVAILCLPILNTLVIIKAPSIVFNMFLLAFFVIWSFCGMIWPCISVMVNNVCPSPEALASVNGLSHISLLLPQAITPASSTILYATSIRSKFMRGHGVWAFLISAGCAAAIHAYTIRLPDHNWRDTLEENSEVDPASN